MTTSMFELAMGDRFAALADGVQRFHRLRGRHLLRGQVVTDAPATWPGRLLAACLGSPQRSRRGEIEFELHADDEREIWIRRFPGRTMRSELRRSGTRVVECLGAARLEFELHDDAGALRMRLTRMWFGGIPCPAWLRPRVEAEETAAQGRLRFRVGAAMPLIGRVVGYRGDLQLPEAT